MKTTSFSSAFARSDRMLSFLGGTGLSLNWSVFPIVSRQVEYELSVGFKCENESYLRIGENLTNRSDKITMWNILVKNNM